MVIHDPGEDGFNEIRMAAREFLNRPKIQILTRFKKKSFHRNGRGISFSAFALLQTLCVSFVETMKNETF